MPYGMFGFSDPFSSPDPLFNGVPYGPSDVDYTGFDPGFGGNYGGKPILGGTPPFIGGNGPFKTGNPALDSIIGILFPTGSPLPKSGNTSNPNQGTGGNRSGIPPWLLPILAGVSGGLDNRPGTTTSVPTFDDKVAPLRQQTIDSFSSLFSKDPDLVGYQTSQTGAINKQSDIAKQNAIEMAAAHGIVGPAVDTSLNSIETNRGNQVTNLNGQVPLLAHSLKVGDLSAVNSFLNGNKGLSVTSPGNVAGGALSGASGLLAYLYGLGGK